MAGLGFDAAIMAGAPERLKARVGWPAYVVSGARNLRGPQFKVRIKAGDSEEFTRRTRTVVIGNCGKLLGGLVLMPEAEITDGQLDLVALSPQGVVGWAAVAARLASRRRRGHPRVDHHTATEFHVRSDRPQEVQLDGDPIGTARAISAEVVPHSLVVRVGTVG
jgi:diacylglycerol kinase family enzyme